MQVSSYLYGLCVRCFSRMGYPPRSTDIYSSGVGYHKRNETKQNKTKKKDVTPDERKKHHGIDIKKRPEDTSSRHFWLTIASKPGRTPLLWAIISFIFPVTFVHTSRACRSPARTFSAVIHSAMKRSAPCPAVLRHSPLSWAAVVHYWSALISKALRSSRRHPVHYFSCPL